MTQTKKRKKTADQFWKKKDILENIFTSVLTVAREMAKTKGKNPSEKILIFLKI